MFRFVRYFMLSFAVLLLISVLLSYRDRLGEPNLWAHRLVGPVAMMVAAFAFLPLTSLLAWRRSKLIQGRLHGSVSDDGIEWKGTYGQSHFPWAVPIKVRTARDYVLIYLAPQQALFFPREFFASDAAWAEFQELVAKHGPKRGPRRGAA